MSAPTAHFIGIGGIHMSGLARILLDEGWTVSGSDLVANHLIDELAARGATVTIGHAAANVCDADLVIHTAAVKDENAEVAAARAAGIELLTRAQMVGRIAQDRSTLTVAGTHGKTTTTTMLTLILREASLDPTYILGGEYPGLASQAARGRGPQAVVEADEYAHAFHEYTPTIAVLTNVERDHLDYYPDEAALQEAFVGYGRTIERQGTLIVGADSLTAMTVAKQLAAERPDITIETFGTNADSSWRAVDVHESASASHFTVSREGAALGTIKLTVPGLFNVRNALAATAASFHGGAPFESSHRALAAFRGVHRRFEVIGEAAGITLIDDYAHHPSEIAETVNAARQRFPNRRLVVLFQPHTYSRSAYLKASFSRCFAGVDLLFFTDTYAAREKVSAGLDAEALAQSIADPEARYMGDIEAAVTAVCAELRSGDICFTMGAGDIDTAVPHILERLHQR